LNETIRNKLKYLNGLFVNLIQFSKHDILLKIQYIDRNKCKKVELFKNMISLKVRREQQLAMFAVWAVVHQIHQLWPTR
jgi:hypothetical protein